MRTICNTVRTFLPPSTKLLLYPSLNKISNFRNLFPFCSMYQTSFINSNSLNMNFEKTRGKVITCLAAVAWKPKQPLDVTHIQVAPPEAGEVRVKIVSNALCHTDVYTLEGNDPEGLFPSVLGHEATAIVESIGTGVTSLVPGDVVIPAYTPECRKHECIFCQSVKTNLCPEIRATQGKGLMPDGTSRLSKDGKKIFHFMGCSTFAEYSVLAEISAAKIHPQANLRQMCLLGCGVSTGWGAVFNTVKMEPLKSVAVFGLGALGLSVIQAAKFVGARIIIGIDINESKYSGALSMGASECINPTKCPEGDVKSFLLSKEKWGFDYTFDCTGNVSVMRTALEVAHRGWGESCVIGVAAAGQEIATRPFQLITGRHWKGTAFGGWKSRSDIPRLVQNVMRGEMSLEPYITHSFEGLDKVNNAIEALHGGECLRAVVHITPEEHICCDSPRLQLSLKSSVKLESGQMKQFTHWSESCQCNMTFSIFLPFHRSSRPLPPVLFYLSGLNCTDENARTKSCFAADAAKYGLAVVFPDTSPRDISIDGDDESYDFGTGAGFYLNAKTDKWKKNYNMFDYVVDELPRLISDLFPVNGKIRSIMGHSMGGHGALIAHLKKPGVYSSVSAFSPICHPTQVPWGQKAFKGYLGSVEAGKQYDATELMSNFSGVPVPTLIDQGTSDPFLDTQLKPQHLVSAADRVGYPIRLRMQSNYDHSYFFVSTFIRDHIAHHATAMGLTKF